MINIIAKKTPLYDIIQKSSGQNFNHYQNRLFSASIDLRKGCINISKDNKIKGNDGPACFHHVKAFIVQILISPTVTKGHYFFFKKENKWI